MKTKYLDNSFIQTALKLRSALLTLIKGIAEEGETPLLNAGPWGYILFSGTSMTVGVLSTHIILGLHILELYPLLVIAFMIVQSGLYTFYHVGIHHAAGHRNLSSKQWVNYRIADIASIVTLSIGREAYRKEHGRDHHNQDKLGTLKDPDYRWWHQWGFVPGKPIEYYWRQFWLTLVNPRYYWVYLLNRLKANFVDAPNYRKMIALGWWTSLITLAFTFHTLPTLLIGYILPVILGVGISALCQGLSEHRWLYQGANEEKTFPRLLDLEVPVSGNTMEWFQFIALAVFYLYWQTAILSTDLANHQLHHEKPGNKDFPLAAFSADAQRDRDKAIWGIRYHFREAFLSLSQAKDPS
jgi:fatty acid desaturase